MMGLLQRLFEPIRRLKGSEVMLPNEPTAGSTERGYRTTPENELRYAYRLMWVDPDVRRTILDIREMDAIDGRVKRVHGRIARDVIRGGLVMQLGEADQVLAREWDRFMRGLQLHNAEKLRSDAKGLVTEGNLPMQWVLSNDLRDVVAAVRMPTETIFINVDAAGRFKDVAAAYYQLDVATGTQRVAFPLWQLYLARFDPLNFDDLGSFGRPFLDASRATWRKLRMTDEDLVIRRRTRAPLRMAHVLEGATAAELDAYRNGVERDQTTITTDYYLNKKGSVSPVQGDAALDEIADVTYLLDTMFAGTPLPKGLMGYTDGMARDILEDLKRDYYDEVDLLQDALAFTYQQGFRLHLLLKGIDPDEADFGIRFAERRTETPNQTADRALKWQALGIPLSMIWEEMGLDPQLVHERRERDAREYEPYPDPHGGEAAGDGALAADGKPRVSITPGNAPKGESATAITNR